MALTKVSYSMIDGAPVNIVDYGADATGATNSSAAIQAAIDAAEGGCLVAEGTFRIDSTLNLKSNSVYNFHGATFIPGGLSISNMFSAVDKENITVIGGNYTGVPGVSPVINSHPTGTYYAGTALYFQDCINVLVTETYTYRIFSVINFYNCSDCTALANSASDCCGGIQSVAGSDISANWKVRGLNYSNNTLLHMGDECYTFLVSTLGTGEYSACKIVGNHLSKDPGVNATIGLASGIHLRGLETTTSNVVRSCVVSDNTAYFCGAAFIRATGAIRCTFANNSVDGFGKAGANAAYWFGSTSTGAFGVFDLTVIGNIAENGLNGSRVIYMEGAKRCHFSSNYGVVNSAGIGAISVLSDSDTNVFDGNIIHNTAAFCIQLASGCDNNLIINNDFSIFVAAAISDSGTNNKKQNNYGYVSFNSGTTTISSGATSQLVNHGLSGSDANRIFVTLTPISNMYSSANAHVEGITTSLFYATVTSAPGGSNVVTFQWIAQEI
jgi:hypothetical protein